MKCLFVLDEDDSDDAIGETSNTDHKTLIHTRKNSADETLQSSENVETSEPTKARASSSPVRSKEGVTVSVLIVFIYYQIEVSLNS